MSAIWAAIIDCLAGAVVVVVDEGAVVVVVPPGTVVAVVLRSGAPPMAIRAVAEWVLTGGSPLSCQVTVTSMRSPRSRSTEAGWQGSVPVRLSAGRQTTVVD
jgi:hypothetical protein